MLETNFLQEVVLSAVDNLALVFLAYLGFLLGRRQERIKAHEELQRLRLEERRTAILEQWNAVRYLHQDTEDVWTETSRSGDDSPSLDRTEEAKRLVAHADEVRRGVRDHRRLLGKRIADAMYASIGVDLGAAKTVAAGQVPSQHTYDNPKFKWLETKLNAMDGEDFPLPGD